MRQICEKSDHNQRSRQFEEEQQKRHFESWETFWGRPGYGAPKPNTTKGNLMKMLHFPEKVTKSLLLIPFSFIYLWATLTASNTFHFSGTEQC